MRKLLIFLFLAVMLVSMIGCAAGPNPYERTPNDENEVAGFWMGLWHGFITPVTFIISLFSDKVHLYEIHNNGNWYNFGFVIGLSAIFGGGGGGSCAARRRRRDG
ncbi:MAG: hypothetical protein JW760_04325 [Spirochaetales bacterium]|nr:hypothetical protein [Spirochaetales bacterium]